MIIFEVAFHECVRLGYKIGHIFFFPLEVHKSSKGKRTSCKFKYNPPNEKLRSRNQKPEVYKKFTLTFFWIRLPSICSEETAWFYLSMTVNTFVIGLCCTLYFMAVWYLCTCCENPKCIQQLMQFMKTLCMTNIEIFNGAEMYYKCIQLLYQNAS